MTGTKIVSAVMVLASSAIVGCGGGQQGSSPPATAATASAPKETAPAAPAFDAQAAMSREAKGLTTHEVAAEGWHAEVLAAAPPVVRKEKNIWTLDVDIGTQSHVRCVVYDRLIDAGQTINAFLGLLKPDKMKTHAVVPTGLKVFRDAPTVFVAALYTAQTPAGLGSGELKIAVQAHETHPVACIHDDLGYRQTFASVLESLADSIQGLPEPDEAKYVEISQVTVADAVVGYSYGRLRAAPSGESEWFEQSLHLIPRSATELAMEDLAELEKIDASGRLVGGVWNAGEGGELRSSITLSRSPSGQYSYEGSVLDKPISGQFSVKNKDGLSSVVSNARNLAKAIRGKSAFELTEVGYSPSLDPTKPTEFHHKGNTSGEVITTVQDRTVTAKVRPDGRTDSWELSMNDVTFVGRTIFTKGAL